MSVVSKGVAPVHSDASIAIDKSSGGRKCDRLGSIWREGGREGRRERGWEREGGRKGGEGRKGRGSW